MRGQYFDRKITREQFDRAQENNGHLLKEDENSVLTDSERLGYGATTGRVSEKDGEFYVICHMYDSCD